MSEGSFKSGIVSIAQTPDGYLWLGSEAGLIRFDGVRRVPWEQLSTELLPSNQIVKVFVSRDGTLWIGTFAGLVSWKGGRLTPYAEFQGTIVTAIIEDRHGAVWASGRAVRPKLCAIRDGTVQCSGEDPRAGTGMIALGEYNGNLWAGGAGLWQWTPAPPKFYPLPNSALDLIEGDSSALWVATADGLMQLVAGKAMPFRLPGFESFNPTRMLRDRGGSFWLGFYSQGLGHLNRGRTDRFTSADGLSSDRVSAIFEDREGTIWVGTSNGLDRFRQFAVPTISVKQGLTSQRMAGFLAARDGSVWISTLDGINRWNDGRLTIYRSPADRLSSRPRPPPGVHEVIDAGLPHGNAGALVEDRSGRIWVGTIRGLAYYQDGVFTPVGAVRIRNVLAMTAGKDGDIWIIDQHLGLLHVLDGKLIEQVPWEKFGRKDWGMALASDDARGGVWVGFWDGGVTYFKDGQPRTSVSNEHGLSGGRVNQIRVNPDGSLWVATAAGLSRIRDAHISKLTSRNGLPCDFAQWSMEDDERLWLKMGCGLVSIPRSELDAWVQDSGRTIKTTVFDSADGVRSVFSSGGYAPKVTRDLHGRLWFEANDGAGFLDPRHITTNQLLPPVHVEQLTADHKPVRADAQGRFRLPPLVRDLQIDYTALSLVAPEKVRFRYMLEGHDRDWQEAGDRRQAFYNDLPPRQHRFRVIASNNSGVWNNEGAVLDFWIAPAYYQTIWFRLACVAAFAAMLFGLYRYRLRQVAAKLTLRHNERLGERTRIARDLHDTLLQSLAGVSLQLHGIAKQATVAPEKTPSMIDHVRQQVDAAFREARQKVYNLRSAALEGQGLPEALNDFVESIRPTAKAQCIVAMSGEPRPCKPEVEEELLRIAQEAMNNANRHAEASEIRIALEYSESSLMLAISDDGRGFDVEEGYRKTGHWGLKNMQERAAQIRGKCKIASAAGRGTQIEVLVPLTKLPRKMRAKQNHSSPGN